MAQRPPEEVYRPPSRPQSDAPRPAQEVSVRRPRRTGGQPWKRSVCSSMGRSNGPGCAVARRIAREISSGPGHSAHGSCGGCRGARGTRRTRCAGWPTSARAGSRHARRGRYGPFDREQSPCRTDPSRHRVAEGRRSDATRSPRAVTGRTYSPPCDAVRGASAAGVLAPRLARALWPYPAQAGRLASSREASQRAAGVACRQAGDRAVGQAVVASAHVRRWSAKQRAGASRAQGAGWSPYAGVRVGLRRCRKDADARRA